MKMTKEEFKKKFKVGDLITCSFWGELKTKIVYIGEDKFACDDKGLQNYEEDGIESYYFNENDWQLWKEPVKKDLEGVQRFYVIKTLKDNSRHIRVFYSEQKKSLIDDLKVKSDKHIEILTEKEAIERGLKP